MFTWTVAVRTLLAALACAALSGAASAGNPSAATTVRGLVVGGRPVFPVMLIDQCTAADVARGRALGVDLIVNEDCGDVSAARQVALLRSGMLGVLPIHDHRTSGAGLIGWTYPDEPDNNGWTPASLAKANPAAGNRGGVTFLTTTGRFFPARPGSSPEPAGVYAGFARLADMPGFDLYPLNACTTRLADVYDAQRAFVQLARGKPTFQWIETGPIRPSYCGGFAMTPAQLYAEVWLAIVGGARGIGYFTHTWTPAHRSFDVAPALQSTIAGTDALLARVEPGLVGTTVRAASDSPAVKVLARSGGGRTYVFAVNTLTSPNKSQVTVPQLHDGPVTVLDEGRTVTATHHGLIDAYGPLQVHVYVQSG